VSSIFDLFKRRPTAPLARERLQILLAHERASAGQEGLVAILREEILAVIAKHVSVERDKVQVKLEREGEMSTLEIDIEMPTLAIKPVRMAMRA
jgi:cell division topological specificity factor